MQTVIGSRAEDIDVASLGRALWRAKFWVLGLAIAAGLLTFIFLSMMRPQYTSEARILIENDQSAFTRPTSDQGQNQQQTLDEQAVQSQVQVLTSLDLALQVAKTLDLANNPEFAKDAGVSPLRRLLNRFGFGRGSDKSELEKAAGAFAAHLAVYPLAKSSVIAIDYSSGDPELAAKCANQLASAYIEWQRKAKLEQTKDATAWLSAEIDELRKRVAESEAAAEKFRASNGLYQGSNNVTLNAQQLSELNSQLILAKAQESEAQARARLIKKMLDDKGDIDAAPDVLKSELIARLIEQRVQVQRQLAELSATLMPSHPRILQLNSELAGVRTQIRDEAAKIVKGLENEAEVASARETSLRNSLNDVKSQASGQGDAEIKLRALEREAKANRDLLDTYLARYRDASARHDIGSVPANAALVSEAHASITPSFPKVVPITLLVMVATTLLSFAFVLARALIGGTAMLPQQVGEPAFPARARPLAETVPQAPAPASSAAAPPEPPQAPAGTPAQPATARASEAPPAKSPASVKPAPISPILAEPISPDVATRGAGPSIQQPSAPPVAKPVVQKSVVQNPVQEPVVESFIDRIRKTMTPPPAPSAGQRDLFADKLAREEPRGAPRPNDLRAYLQERASQSTGPVNTVDPARADAPGKGRVGSILRSLELVVNHVLSRVSTTGRNLVLLTTTGRNGQAPADALEISRAIAADGKSVLLVDLARGASLSASLGLPRSPGLSDLVAGKATFGDIIQLDHASPLQVVLGGAQTALSTTAKPERLKRILDALGQAYDCVVVYADPPTAGKLEPQLTGSLALVLAALPHGVPPKENNAELTPLTAFGCLVTPFEQGAPNGHGRAGLLGRIAASPL